MKNKIKTILEKYDNNIDVYISTNKVYAMQVKTIMNTNVFHHGKYKGYILFIDTDTTANFGHRCDYYLLSNEGFVMLKAKNIWPIEKDIDMINIFKNGSYINY